MRLKAEKASGGELGVGERNKSLEKIKENERNITKNEEKTTTTRYGIGLKAPTFLHS